MPLLVPRYDDPNFVEAIQQIVDHHEVSIVLPLIDPDIPILSQHKASLPQAAANKYAVVSPAAAAIGGDKWQTFHFFKDIGLPTPESWIAEDFAGATAELPRFVKPRRGSAAKNAFRADTLEELDFFKNYVPDAIVQECLTGPEVTVDVVCGPRSEILATAARQRISVRDGEVMQGVTVDAPEITAGAVAVARALEACGPITVQCMLHHQRPYFLEINARLGGGIPLASAAGVQVPELIIAGFSCPERLTDCSNQLEIGKYVTRFDNAFFLNDSQLDSLKRSRLSR